MERYFSLAEASARRLEGVGRVATVGFFDGVHLGHVHVIEQLAAWAKDVGSEPAVVTFDRHPQSIFGGHPPVPVISLDHRLLLLERYGVAATLVMPFDLELASWSPERFVEEILVDALGARRLLMGYDGAFGKGRQGTYEYLSEHREVLGLELRQVGEFGDEGATVSSTRIRTLLTEGRLEDVEPLLGRPFSLIGKVVRGFERGRELGFPTANLDIGEAFLLPRGVYFVTARSLGKNLEAELPGAEYAGVMNVGRSPTFEGNGEGDDSDGVAFDPERDRVEVYLLDFDGDLYGDVLDVIVHRHHRAERRFDSVEDLTRKIAEDVESRRRSGL